jgi:hypothetical protein
MLFHFDIANYVKMVRLAWNEKNPMARRYYLAVLILAIPVVSTFHAICFFLDGILFPGLHRIEVREPVFVLGHARSGTTLVHRLMSEDEGRFSSFMLYELYFPSLLQKKVIRVVAAFDRKYLGAVLEKRVQAWEEKRYAKMKGMHEMGLTIPEEDDMVFYYSCASGFWISKMPYMGDLDFYYVDEMPERRRRRLMRFYRDCVRRQLYLNGADKVHLSKNPIFAGRVESLIEEFPDARFVVPVRNPYETIPSLLKLVSSGWRRLRWDPERVDRCLQVLAEQSFHTYRYPVEVLARHPNTRSAAVDYRELTSDPAATIEGVYEQLGLEVSDDYRQVLAAKGRRERTHESKNSYSLQEFGLDADAIHTELAPMFEQYGWDRETAPVPGANPIQREARGETS